MGNCIVKKIAMTKTFNSILSTEMWRVFFNMINYFKSFILFMLNFDLAICSDCGRISLITRRMFFEVFNQIRFICFIWLSFIRIQMCES